MKEIKGQEMNESEMALDECVKKFGLAAIKDLHLMIRAGMLMDRWPSDSCVSMSFCDIFNRRRAIEAVRAFEEAAASTVFMALTADERYAQIGDLSDGSKLGTALDAYTGGMTGIEIGYALYYPEWRKSFNQSLIYNVTIDVAYLDRAAAEEYFLTDKWTDKPDPEGLFLSLKDVTSYITEKVLFNGVMEESFDIEGIGYLEADDTTMGCLTVYDLRFGGIRVSINWNQRDTNNE